MNIKTLDDIEVSSKVVLVRLDLNVPLVEGKVTDSTRIDRSIHTIKELQQKGAKIVLMSHFGRPKQADKSLSLAQIVPCLQEALDHSVKFVEDCIGEQVKAAVDELKDGDILLLENLRFHSGEQNNDADFAQELASLADVCVQDALSVAHRAHASTYGINQFIPMVAGRALEKEISALEIGLENPEHPVVAIVGGAKVSTKIDLLKNLVTKVDALVIGGAMANSFLLAQGFNMGKSLVEEDILPTANEIMELAQKANCAIILPIDAVVAWHFEANAPHQTYGVDAMPEDGMMLDIGDLTIAKIESVIEQAKTVLWNGPLGAFELHPFNRGTVSVAQIIAQRTEQNKLISVGGGGDTVSALNDAKAADKFTYLSTAGGAFLEWLEGKSLPTISLLMKN